MLGIVAISKTYYSQICIERVVDGQTVYTPVADLCANVPDGTKIPININVDVRDRDLYTAHADEAAEDYAKFQKAIKDDLSK